MSDSSALRRATRRHFLRQAVVFGIGTTLVAACGPSGAGSQPTTAPAPAAQPTQPPAAAKPTSASAPAAAPTTAPAAAVAPTAAPAQAAPAQAGANLTGTITVSYPDELGKKPPYVQAAADQVTKANPSAKITMNTLEVTRRDGCLVADGGWPFPLTPRASNLPAGPLTLGVRPEDIAVSLAQTAGAYPATVFVSEPLGNEVIVNVHVGDALIKVRALPSLRPVRGQTVYLTADPDRLHLFGDDGGRLNG